MYCSRVRRELERARIALREAIIAAQFNYTVSFSPSENLMQIDAKIAKSNTKAVLCVQFHTFLENREKFIEIWTKKSGGKGGEVSFCKV